MYIKRLRTSNFRNIKSAELEFSPGINVLYGSNAAGKTNTVEAVNLFALGKSMRGSSDRDMIAKGETEATLELDFVKEKKAARVRNNSLYMRFTANGKKNMLENGTPVDFVCHFIGNFIACSFTPDDVAIVTGTPEERRRYLDIALCQTSRAYLEALRMYRYRAKEKNRYIKQVWEKQNGKYDREYICLLNDLMSVETGKIVQARHEICSFFCDRAGQYYSEITGSKEKLAIRYSTQSGDIYDDISAITAKYREILNSAVDTEVRARRLLYGIQRDEVQFYLANGSDRTDLPTSATAVFADTPDISDTSELSSIYENGFSARYFGSRGQQKSVVLAMKLAQSDQVYEKTGEYPVLLLDDVFSELDAGHRAYLLSKMQNRQVIITCCDCDAVQACSDFKGINVVDGRYIIK